MDVTSLLIIIAVIFIGFILLYKFFKDDLSALRDSVNATKDTVNSSLTASTKDIHDRLLHATEVMGEIKREAGAFAETSRSMRELQDYLRSPKLRGNIGEMVLKDLVSQMFPKSSYSIQYPFKSGEKVDLVIKTDGGLLPIDSKFPMENFQKLAGAIGKDQEQVYRKAFMRDIKFHVSAISKKYILPQENTLDFALMYIPSESVYYEVSGQEELMEFARSSRVYPVSPNTLYAALQTILLSFEGRRIEARAKEVFTLLRAIQKDYDKNLDTFSTLGTHLKSAYNKYSEVQIGFNSLGQKLASTRKLSGKDGKSLLIEEEV